MKHRLLPLAQVHLGDRRGPLSATPHLLRHGYWDYSDPERVVRGMLGAEACRRLGFTDALAAEERGERGQVLRWAAWVQNPPAVRAIVEVACGEAGPAGCFDETEVARGRCPADGAGSAGTVVLHARRRAGGFCYRLTGSDAPAPATSGSPLAPEVVHAMLCGSPAEIVARGVARLLEWSAGLTRGGVTTWDEHRGEWLPQATSRFYDFAAIEEDIRGKIVGRVLRHHGLPPSRP